MKRILKRVFILGLFFCLVFITFMAGNYFGKSAGAQFYVRKLWKENEMQISSDKIANQINEYRKKKNLPPFEESAGLCKIAQVVARNYFASNENQWNETKLEYIETAENTMKEITTKEANELCPECNFDESKALHLNPYAENRFVYIRPDVCTDDIKNCTGEEEFDLVEKLVENVVSKWIANPETRKILEIENITGCVKSYGGAVIFSVKY